MQSAAMNNTRTAGGSIGRQGRVSFPLIFESFFLIHFYLDVSATIW